MTGHVFPHHSGKGFSVRVHLGYREDGARITKVLPERGGDPFRRKQDAERAARLLKDQFGSATWVSDLTVGEYLTERWLPSRRERGLKPKTLADYEWHVQRVVAAIGTVTLPDLKAHHIVDFQRAMADTDSRRRDGKLSKSTIAGTMRILRMAVADAHRLGLIDHDPADRAKPDLPRLPQRTRDDLDLWTPEQLNLFLSHDAVRTDRLYAMWSLLAFTGMRAGEVCGLHGEDFDAAEGTVHVRRSRVMVEGKPVDQDTPKTSRSNRVLPLPKETVEALKGWVRQVRRERLACPPEMWEGPVGGAPHLFVTETGKPLNPESVSRRFQRRIRRVEGLPKIKLHGLRNTHATMLADNPALTLADVADRLGHASVDITDRIYRRPTLESGRRVVEQLDAVIMSK